MPDVYRGSQKHKDWKPGGGFGTLCPRWTHDIAATGYAGDPLRHPWMETTAQALLDDSIVEDGKRFACRRGIAFEAKLTGDGTWHGYPVPWENVPTSVQDLMIKKGHVRRRDIRRQVKLDTGDVRWALLSDDN